MVLHHAANLASGIASSHNWDRDVFSHMFVAGRSNRAEQNFEKRFREIDFKIQRQELHREDIRDLVELTTARMDVYHIVGTLLLTFCIQWYTDNAILRNRLPIWFADLFLISNFAAVGYLILSVWLAMYAAIASRSIGTRLLTSFARLSLPTESEINDVKFPIFFYFDDLFKRKVLRRETPSSKARALLSTRNNGQVVSMDDQQHLRRFLQALPRWLSYDLYSRVCMSFGMNQMLQALSYYVLGVIWKSSPMAAATSFVAVKSLSLLILWIDVGDDIIKDYGDALALLFLHFGPPTLAFVILYSSIEETWLHATLRKDLEYKKMLSFMATLCFWGHAGWLWYMFHITVDRVGTSRGSFRVGAFVNVLEWVQTGSVRKDLEEAMRSARQNILGAMVGVMQIEASEGCVRASARRSDKFHLLFSELKQACDATATDATQEQAQASAAETEAELRLAGDVARRFEVWARAPEILSSFAGLRHKEVQTRLTRSEREAAEQAHQAFLELCQKHDLGMYVQEKSSRGAFVALPLAVGDARIVHLDTSPLRGSPLWIDTETGEVLLSSPLRERRTTSYSETLDAAFPAWRSGADALPPASAPRAGCDRAAVGAALNGGAAPGAWLGPQEVEFSSPDDDLPVRLVKYFSMGAMVWWLVSGCAHAALVLTNEEGNLARLADQTFEEEESLLEKSALHVNWPEPAQLFKVDSLHCDDGHVWVSNKFLLYAAAQTTSLLEHNSTSKTSNNLGTLTEVRDGIVGTVFCRGHTCNALSPPAQTGPWLLESLGRRANTSSPVILPHSWRLVNGKWGDCRDETNPDCDHAWLAGWDGSRVFAATLRWAERKKAWSAHTRFELAPALGHRDKYDDVKALELSQDGGSLMVLLSDGIVHVWDLSKGKVQGRLLLGGEYSSMCRSGNRLFLSQQDRNGPRLVAVELPQFVTKLLQNGSSASASEVPQSGHMSKSGIARAPNLQAQGVISTHEQGKTGGRLESATGRLASRQQRFLGPALVQMDRILKRFAQGVLHESSELEDDLPSKPSKAKSTSIEL